LILSRLPFYTDAMTNQEREWWVRIIGSEKRITAAAAYLTEAGYRIIQQTGETYLVSDRPLNEDANLVMATARATVQRINLLAQLMGDKDRSEPVELFGFPKHKREDGSFLHLVFVEAIVNVEAGSTMTVQKDGQDVQIAVWLTQEDDPAAPLSIPPQFALKLAGDPVDEGLVHLFVQQAHDWTVIYKVVEYVRPDLDQSSPGWISPADLDALKRAANSIQEAGGTGRHARRNFKGHPSPITIDGAAKLARQALLKWLSI
jgi:hypothetical protein